MKAMPLALAQNLEAMTGCVSGAARIEELQALLSDAGFQNVKIAARPESAAIIGQCMPGA